MRSFSGFRKTALLLAGVLVTLLSLTATGLAAKEFGTGCTFARGTTQCVSTSESAPVTESENQDVEQAGSCTGQTVTLHQSRSRSRVDHFQRTLLYHGNNHLKGKLYSDSGDVFSQGTYTEWSVWTTESTSTEGTCDSELESEYQQYEDATAEEEGEWDEEAEEY